MKNGAPAITKGAKFGETPTLSKGKGDPPKELKVVTISEGNGPALKKGDVAQVNYYGQVWDGKEPFDQSFGKGKPFEVTVGAGMVIKGWDQGLEGKKVGSRVELVIPPDLGYGEKGSGDKIKPNATLVFVVDIVKGTSVPASATGKEVAQDNKDLPKIGTNTDGKEVSVTVPKDTTPPLPSSSRTTCWRVTARPSRTPTASSSSSTARRGRTTRPSKARTPPTRR